MLKVFVIFLIQRRDENMSIDFYCYTLFKMSCVMSQRSLFIAKNPQRPLFVLFWILHSIKTVHGSLVAYNLFSPKSETRLLYCFLFFQFFCYEVHICKFPYPSGITGKRWKGKNLLPPRIGKV